MTHLNNDLPSVLRRRAKQLQSDDGFNDQYVSVFLRSADELQALQALATPGSDVALTLETIAHNRRMRQVLVELLANIHGSTMASDRRDRAERQIKGVLALKPFGEGRKLLTVEITGDTTRQQIEGEVAKFLDRAFPPVSPENLKNLSQFHAHLEVCAQCRDRASCLCPTGAALRDDELKSGDGRASVPHA